MRILMDGALRSNGPMETFIERQILMLRAHAVEVEHLPGMRHHRIWQKFAARCRKLFAGTVVSRDVRRLFATADIVHFQWPANLLKWFPVTRRFKKPVVLSLRGRQITVIPHMPGQEEYVRRLRQALPFCDGYHCVSKDIRLAGEAFGLSPGRARVITPAVDTGFFVPCSSPLSTDPLKIVMVGGLTWVKGFEYALMALSHVVEAGVDATLSIVGEGPESDRIEYAAEDLGIRSRVHLLGGKPPVEVRGILQKHHVFLHTSLTEGIANVVLEAMACGLPVVSTAAGGMAEAVDDAKEGFLVPPREVRAMADRIVKLATNMQLRNEMGQRARARAVRDFDLKDQGRKFVELYQEVLSRHAHRFS